MNKKNKLIKWLMLLGWMGIIFIMSHQPGDVSSSQSDLVMKIFSFIGIRLDSYFGDLATLVIRKAAHFTEYLILYILIYRVICLYVNKRIVLIYSLFAVLIYAGTDEIHQHFIPGRVMAFKDVMIDTSGGFMAMILTWTYEKIKVNRR